MAHTKAKGTTKLGRDSQSQRLGIKRFGGQIVSAGEVLVRQRGSKWYAGENVGRGKDDTLFALKSGNIAFFKKAIKNFDGKKRVKTFIAVTEVASKK